MKISKINLTAGFLLVMVGLVLLSQATLTVATSHGTENIDPMVYPRILIYLLMASGVIIAFKPSASACAQGDGIPFISWRIVSCCAIMLLYALLFNILGFALASYLATVSLAYTMGWRRIGTLLWISALGVGIFWVFFRYILKIILPTGIFL